MAPNAIELHAVLGICFGTNCAAPLPSTNPFVNPGFESGTLSGWTATGIAAARTFPHTGTTVSALPKTCTNNNTSVQASVTVSAMRGRRRRLGEATSRTAAKGP